MLKQLRRKFILINMLLVTLVLVVALSIQLFSVWQQFSGETDSALRTALQWSEGDPGRWQIGLDRAAPPGLDGERSTRVPAFCVSLRLDGSVSAVWDNNVEITDEILFQALAGALTHPDDSGTLDALGLRFLRAWSGGSLRIAFADVTWMRGSMLRQLLTSVLALAGSLAGFFLVSLFLSRWALRPVERSWKQQQQFVADASHELKTPLTVLLADVDILLSHPDETIESQRKWVEYIRDEGERMKELVEDMLFLARCGSGAAREEPHEPLSLSDLCQNCLLSFEPVAFERGVELSGDVAEDVQVQGSREQLRRLAAILLDNACKYCTGGGAAALTLKRAGDRAELSVRNTGAPIPQEALPHLFERFYRVDQARDRGSGGYGLGLSIAASIAEAHRGKIAAENVDGGVVFTVTLPVLRGGRAGPGGD